MAISYPRDFPAYCVGVRGSTDLAYQQAQSITGGAQPNVADLGPAYWVFDYTFGLTGRAMIAAFSAWLSSLDGGLRAFKAVPVRGGKLYKWPLSRPAGFAGLLVSGSPWSGAGNLSAIAVGKDAVTINQLPNGLALDPGDYLSFAVGGKQHLHQIVEGGTVVSNAVTVGVRPYVRPNAVTSVSVRFESPYCDAVVMGKPSKPQDDRATGSVSFQAAQVMI